ncbi:MULTISPECIES: hypothetical protein [unclassified Xanthobacter]|uniref:hypothetical protein n=1 Tax=unclassified Xanthobacter TaxID=2623496 RepID=UPI001F40379A|nr:MULTISPECIES: hypothetical protein [unclassified Xanthobacter]
MFIGQLVKAIAEATGVPEATVAVYTRVLRESGLITSGARGVNAPKMTTLDAARVLLAMIITDKPSRAAEAVSDFGSLRSSQFTPHQSGKWENFNFRKARKLPEDHTFEQAICTLIDIYAFDNSKSYFQSACPKIHPAFSYNPLCEITVRLFNIDAKINIPGGVYYYHDPLIITNRDPLSAEELTALTEAHLHKSDKYKSLIRVEKKVMADVVDAIALAFREDDH